MLPLRNSFIKTIESNNKNKIKEILKVLKYLIKDKEVPARPKFYALLLIKEMLEIKNSLFVTLFTHKFKRRFYELAIFKLKDTSLSFKQKGEKCLDQYYKNYSKENAKYSFMFFTLLWECWKRWD